MPEERLCAVRESPRPLTCLPRHDAIISQVESVGPPYCVAASTPVGRTSRPPCYNRGRSLASITARFSVVLSRFFVSRVWFVFGILGVALLVLAGCEAA